MADDVTVVICVYTLDRWADIVAGAHEVCDQQPPPREVLIVVDHNEELLVRGRAELDDATRGVRVVASTEKQGLSGARNTGVGLAQGSIVAFLDDDAKPEGDWLARLVAPFVESDVMVTGGRPRPAWPGARPRWFPAEFDWVVGSAYRGMPQVRCDVRNVIGASMAVRRVAFAQAGLFTEDVGRVGLVPLGCEETELCIRIRREIPNARVVYEPASVVAHRVSAARTHPRYFASRCLAEGKSKAQISALVGTEAATATERAYATRTLPLGVVRGIADVARADVAGMARAAAIVVGFVLTAFGFARARVTSRT